MNSVSPVPGPMHNYFATLGSDYIARGYHVIPIKPGDKRPMDSGWPMLRLDLDEHTRRASGDALDAGVGILTGISSSKAPGVAVYLADVDTRNDQVAKEMRDWLNKNLGYAPERVGLAPKFGAVFSAPPGAAKITSSKFYDPGHIGDKNHSHMLEWLGAGQQFVAHGVHPDTGKPYEHSGTCGTLVTLRPNELPAVTDAQKKAAIAEFERLCRAAGLLQVGVETRITVGRETSDPARDLTWQGKPAIPIAQVKEALDVLTDLVDDYDTWIRVGMACHHQGRGAPDEGDWLDLWDGWSATGLSYNGRSEVEAKWKGFAAIKGHARPTTVATILAMAKEARTRMKYSAVDQYRQRIEAASTDQMLREGVCATIARDASLETIDREVLVGMVQSKIMALNGGAKPRIALVRDLLQPIGNSRRDNIPDWIEPWVWNTEDDTFYNTKTKENYTKTSFDAAYNRRFGAVTESGKPAKVRASDVALDTWNLPVVSGVRYLPGCEPIFTMDGLVYANSYRADLIPQVPPVLSTEDEIAILALKRHLELLVPVDEHRDVLTQALAWVTRNPGRKMHWAPLIKGIEGDGKSVLARLLANVMGHRNVRVLSPGTLSESGFTGWAENNCVIAIEELMIKGPKRYEAMNKLKPIITNDYIEVHRKGRDPYTAPNTSNVIAMTNHEDAIPLTDTDRRWFVLFSPWARIGDLAEALVDRYGVTLAQHWEELWHGVDHQAGALRGWLESIDLSSFQPFARAPDTPFKAEMVAVEISDMELAVKEILEEGEFGQGQDGIALGPLISSAVKLQTGEKPYGRPFNRAMVGAGFRLHPKQTVKYAGKSYRVYVTDRWAKAPIGEVSAHLRSLGKGTMDF